MIPSAWETYRLLTGNAGNYPRLKDWNWPVEAEIVHSPAGLHAYFWIVLYNSYLGATGQTSAGTYNAAFDCNSNQFNYYYWDTTANPGFQTDYGELTYATIKAAVNDAIADMGARLANVSKEGTWLTRQPPVSALNLKYRINPAGADLRDYQFNMIDRTLTVTKADGDKRASAVSKLEVKQSGADQLNVTGYVNYFKYWADQPVEWFLHLFATKQVYSYLYWDAFDSNNSIPNRPRAEKYAELLSKYINNSNVNPYYAADVNAYAYMSLWMRDNGMDHETIVALEAAKNGKGAEAIVSDYAAVKLEYVAPIWTAYNHNYNNDGFEKTAARWRMAQNWGMYFASAGDANPRVALNSAASKCENDYLVEGTTYDVASHMRFADPYYGRLEDLGFKVKYDYYVFEEANTESFHNYGGSWADAGGSPSGEYEYNWSGWDKVTCTADGKVSLKEDAEDYLGKYVKIVADASIYDETTGSYYTSAEFGASPMWWDNQNVLVDEFIGHYTLLIVPDSNKTINVEYDLGDFDYLQLPQSAKTPISIALDALGMDLEGFNNVYNDPVVTSSTPVGYSATFARAADVFSVTLSNKTQLGNGAITYTFTPKDSKYSTLCYTIKWNVVIDYTPLVPILNPDYILYEDGVLAETIITPDPKVDSIIVVKGKNVDGKWAPQSSIREHILDYGATLAEYVNVTNLHMSIDYAKSQQTAETAHIFSTALDADQEEFQTYSAQEIILDTPYKEFEVCRDYVVDMNVTLANGHVEIVKSYIVRFVCPIKLYASDVTLETHKTDWCADRSFIEIREVGTEKVLGSFDGPLSMYFVISNYARQTYGGVFEGMDWYPTWKSLAPASFGGNLVCEPATGWFYWENDGGDLQVDKTCEYQVNFNFPKLVNLAGKGYVKVLSTANSNSAHIDHAEFPVQPGDYSHATIDYKYED